MYSKKSGRGVPGGAQERRRAPVDGNDRPSMFLPFQEFKLPRQLRRAGRRELGRRAGPLDHDGGREDGAGGSDAGRGRQEFVDRFWEARNPQPGNPDNTFKTAFDRRVAFADAYFIAGREATRGSMTDRGMVFVLLGPPTYVGRKPIRDGRRPERRDRPVDGRLRASALRPARPDVGRGARGLDGSARRGCLLRPGDPGRRREPELARDLALPKELLPQGASATSRSTSTSSPARAMASTCCSATRGSGGARRGPGPLRFSRRPDPMRRRALIAVSVVLAVSASDRKSPRDLDDGSSRRRPNPDRKSEDR